MSATFEGFKPDAVRFLLELRANNERDWFQPRKAEYERLLRLLEEESAKSTLPHEPTARAALNELLVRVRLK